MSRTPAQEARRKKRQTKRNGDRQYFAAVRKIRRHKIDQWMLEHRPERFKKLLASKALAAKKRQWKQERRDLMRTMPIGAQVRPEGTRAWGEVIAHTTDREFPVTVMFKSGICEDFAPEKLNVR